MNTHPEIHRIRADIEAGTYETPGKLAVAFERAMAAAIGPADQDGTPLVVIGQGDYRREIREEDLNG